MPLKPDDLKSLDAYRRAIREDASRLASGPNTRFWIYRDVALPGSGGRPQKLPVFFVLTDDRATQALVKGKSLLCKGKCGMDSGEIGFVPDRGKVPVNLLKKSVPELLGKRLRIPPDDGDEPPDHSGLDIDKIKKIVIQTWSGTRLVKVVSAKRGALTSVRGYVTQEKYIAGKSCKDMETLLGLPSGELKEGAQVMRLKRLPQPAEFELRGYTNTPGGKPYNGGAYRPGSGIPQWKLIRELPADPVKLVGPGDKY